MTNRRGIMGFIFPFLLMFSSCDLLQTRAPEEPQGEKTTLPPATTAEIAVANFQTALQQNDAQEYLRLFSDSTQGGMRYTFLPARTAGISYATLFSRWTRESERDWMLNIATHLTAGTSPRLVLEPSRLTPFQADSALLEATYSLSIPHQDAALPKLFTGTMYLMLAPNRNTGLWTIFRWEDVETRKDSSWSMAKGYFGR